MKVDKKWYPGATTIIGQVDKPFLVKWANNLGLDGKDYEIEVNHSAKVGELIHRIIQSHLLKQEIEIPQEYSDEDLEIAEKAFYRYLEWEKEHTITDIEIEKELFSETYHYKGLLDIYCKVDGKWTIIDIKTSKSIGIEQKMQVSAYDVLVRENELPVEQRMIINTGKLEDSKLLIEEITSKDAVSLFNVFKVLLDLYYARKEIGWK